MTIYVYYLYLHTCKNINIGIIKLFFTSHAVIMKPVIMTEGMKHSKLDSHNNDKLNLIQYHRTYFKYEKVSP